MTRQTVWLAVVFLAAGAQAAGETTWPRLVDLEGQEHRPLQAAEVRAVVFLTDMAECPIVNSYATASNRRRAD